MIKNKTGYIGIDIGTHAVKMAQVEMRGAALKLVDAVSIPRSNPWTSTPSQQQNPITSANEIKAAHSIGDKFSGASSASTATMALCDVRQMPIDPSSNDGLTRKMIQSQFESIERFADEPRTFDYWPITKQWKTEQPSVFVLSLKQSWATQIAHDHRNSKIKCEILDGIPMALSRAVHLGAPQDSNLPVAIIDWGYTRATFCLAVNGSPVFVRILRNSGFGNIVRQVSQELQVPLVQAESVLTNHGMTSKDERSTDVQRTLSVIIKESTNAIADEVSRTLKYIRADRNNPMPEQLKLFGGGATMRGATELFNDTTGLATEVWGLPLESNPAEAPKCPLPLLGPAIAMSTLAWSQS